MTLNGWLCLDTEACAARMRVKESKQSREAERATAAVERSGTARLLRELGMPAEADKVERTPLYLFIERAWARDAEEPAEFDYGALGYLETELVKAHDLSVLADSIDLTIGSLVGDVMKRAQRSLGWELPISIIHDATDID